MKIGEAIVALCLAKWHSEIEDDPRDVNLRGASRPLTCVVHSNCEARKHMLAVGLNRGLHNIDSTLERLLSWHREVM